MLAVFGEDHPSIWMKMKERSFGAGAKKTFQSSIADWHQKEFEVEDVDDQYF